MAEDKYYEKLQTETDEPRQWGDFIKEAYDDGLAGIGKKIWSGTKQVLLSKTGKGALIGLAAAAVVIPLFGGALASAGALTISGAAVPTFEAGIAAGIGALPGFMLGIGGITTALIGGAAGYMGLFSGKEEVYPTAEEARIRAAQLSAMRGDDDMQAELEYQADLKKYREHPLRDDTVDPLPVPPKARERGGNGTSRGMGR